MSDDFFADIGNDKPFVKMALEGFAGSGKTHTAVVVAIGVHRMIGSKKPIVFFDTEKASKFVKPLFDEAGIKVKVKSSRSLADLTETMARCRDGFSDVLIIDSVSHCWQDWIEAYQRKKNRDRLSFDDWGPIKTEWRKRFSDPFVRDPYHIMMCGRVSFEYENEVNEKTGKREIFKSGLKFRADSDLAYEPDWLLLMERQEVVIGKDKDVWREATVLKDRSRLIDGKTFRNPTFECFEPAVRALFDGQGDAVKHSAERNSGDLIEDDSGENWGREKRQRAIYAEEIQGELARAWGAQTAEHKAKRQELLERHFGTVSWTKISEATASAALKRGLDALRAELRPPPVDDNPMPDWGAAAPVDKAEAEALVNAERAAPVGGQE